MQTLSVLVTAYGVPLVGGAAWVDPRPFVVDGRAPLVPHADDNGFPSDHTTVAGWGMGALAAAVGVAVAGLLTTRVLRRWPRLGRGAAPGAGAVDLERTPRSTMAS